MLLALSPIVVACQREQPAAPALVHEAYVWQRRWTPAVVEAVREAGPQFAGYRVLAAEIDGRGTAHAAAPDFAALERGQFAVTAVLRIDGSAPPADAHAVLDAVRGIAARWRSAGVRLRGIEIDHDCATARLAGYAALLRTLRSDWPDGLALSITALPDWIDAVALGDVLAVVDSSVLQVHAVQSPATGLFDAALARRWIDRYAARTSKPFLVALPAYGLRVRFDDGGAPTAVEAEAPRDASAADAARELRVEPTRVAELLRGIEGPRPPRLAGIAWFRLPTADDRRAWSLATLRAVIAGDPLRPAVVITFDADASGANDLVLANRGVVDAPLPATIVIAALGCSAGDALEGYRLERRGDDWRFVRGRENMLAAGRERRVGWLRCDEIGGLKVDEAK